MFANQVEAYNRLSPEFQKRLHGLKALHSGKSLRYPNGARFLIIRLQATSKPRTASFEAASCDESL